MGDLPRIELFARSKCDGWDSWGDEVDSDIVLIGSVMQMAYVPVSKDLTKIRTKIAFNLTKRQLICFGLAVLIGLPSFFIVKTFASIQNGAVVMVVLMIPFFLFAMYEKHGQPLEVIIKRIIDSKYRRPLIRPYKTTNLYHEVTRQISLRRRSTFLTAVCSAWVTV